MRKYFLVGVTLFILLGCILIYQSITYNDKKLHVVFCDVGQGDAIFIRTPQGSDILIDGGPDDSVLACLGKHMPFWDRMIEIMVLTHPHADHFTGLFSVLKNYTVRVLATGDLINKTVGFSSLMDEIKAQKIPMKFVFAGDRFVLRDGVVMKIVGPTRDFLEQTSPNGLIGENGEQASLESLLTYGKFSALLTGDSQVFELKEMLQSFDFAQDFSTVSVLQIPHHGSKTGLSQDILERLSPQLAVISVGKNNKFGHPTPFILDLLKSENIKTLRTDQIGDIEIISDGNSFLVKN